MFEIEVSIVKSFGMLIISTVLSAGLLYFNVDSFYNKFNTGNTYYWINGILAVLFLAFLINNVKDIIKKNYIN